MTNKDTERLVQMHMQQTIPDKAALWERIESNLPEQPAFPEIRHSPSRIRTVYRVIGAAACFLLIAGSLGVWMTMQGMHFSKSETAVMNNTQDIAPAADAAPAAYEAAEEADEEAEKDKTVCEEAPADAAFDEADGAAVNEKQNLRGADAEYQTYHDYAPNAQEEMAEAGNAAAAAADTADVQLTGTVRGEAVRLTAGDLLLEQSTAVLEQGTALPESDPTAQAQTDGIVLQYVCGGQTLTLTALDGAYRLIADGTVYPAPEEAVMLLRSLEDQSP